MHLARFEKKNLGSEVPDAQSDASHFGGNPIFAAAWPKRSEWICGPDMKCYIEVFFSFGEILGLISCIQNPNISLSYVLSFEGQKSLGEERFRWQKNGFRRGSCGPNASQSSCVTWAWEIGRWGGKWNMLEAEEG